MIWNPKMGADECWHCGGGHSTSDCAKPAPSLQPEMPSGTRAERMLRDLCPLVPGQYLQMVADALATQGLTIVAGSEKK
jgi:hypothetical protein